MSQSIRNSNIQLILKEIEHETSLLNSTFNESYDPRSEEEQNEEHFQRLLYLQDLTDELQILMEADDSVYEDDTESLETQSIAEGLAIVIGHEKRRPGAKGTFPSGVTHEYSWNTDLADKIMAVASQKNLRAEIFRRDNVGVVGAYRLVRKWNPQATVELHFNSFNSRALGTETLWAMQSSSESWASELQDEMVKLYQREGRADRKLKDRTRGGRGKLSLSQIHPSALIEPFFGDNLGDAELGEEKKQELAEAIVSAFVSKFGVSADV